MPITPEANAYNYSRGEIEAGMIAVSVSFGKGEYCFAIRGQHHADIKEEFFWAKGIISESVSINGRSLPHA
ncbi:hypothetical protein Agabi119p4_11759 [Agaricus bisporus var. burnettii]|uniref:Uncharacterized protein n=1 Tax=Agaricus bisporus var. burnettii TaxID=192524 RepID=A0A8H7BX37_AGABI|nr:hypothetical protein Agabi119p4_11759 [Agaricus bisporus var. burnettii]